MTESSQHLDVDLVIFGGGIAGLWMLARFLRQGYRTVLIETDALGAGQTRYAQGIIHGGTKYALTGQMSETAKMVAKMPSRWRECIAGKGELDLQGVKILSQYQYLWSTASLTSKMAGFFASKLMRSRTHVLEKQDYPELFKDPGFRGQVYQLDEPVLDVASLLDTLAKPNRDYIIKTDASSIELQAGNPCHVILGSPRLELKAKKIILAAGKGNRTLLDKLQRGFPKMQLRPLKMVALRGTLPALYAHCLGASSKPRITINSAVDSKGNTVWYLGGQLAEEGVGVESNVLIDRAKHELEILFPWYDFSHCQWMTLEIDRAEVAQAKGHLPDDVFASDDENIITAWPTKLALSPVLADRVEKLIKASGIEPDNDEVELLREKVKNLPHPENAPLPWNEEQRWS